MTEKTGRRFDLADLLARLALPEGPTDCVPKIWQETMHAPRGRIRSVFVFLLVAMHTTVCLLLPKREEATRGGRGEASSPSPIVIVALVGAGLGYLVLRMKNRGSLLSREGLLKTARRCEGEAGTLVEEGPVEIWYPGDENPAPTTRLCPGSARRSTAEFCP